jgi:hypothetical protein
MRCVPQYISHYQNSAFCVSVQVPEKLSEELITFNDAEPARSQRSKWLRKELLLYPRQGNTKSSGEQHALSDTQ